MVLSGVVFVMVAGAVMVIGTVIPKKDELLIRYFEPFWISRVFHFSLGKFAKIARHLGPLVASDSKYLVRPC